MVWKKEKFTVKTPFYGNDNIYNRLGMPYPIDEARRFLKEVKHLLIGQKLDKVLVYGFNGYYNRNASNVPLNDYSLDDYEWEGEFLFIINKHVFEVDIAACGHYELALNTTKINKIINTKKLKESEVKHLWVNNPNEGEYLNISHIFATNVLKQKIIDIELTAVDDDDYQYLENVIIKFENGKALLIEEGVDNPVIHLLEKI